jgi:hypothetical protein
MAATAGHRLSLDPMGKCSNAFFSETTNMIKAKLYMNVHWMVPWAVWFQLSQWFKRRSVLKHFPHKVKLNPAVAAILNFISEQKT